MSTLPLILFDATLRGMLVAVLVLLAAVLLRERPQLPAVRVAVALFLGLCIQTLSSAPPFEAEVPRAWQGPLVAVSVGNAVLFWVLIQALFDDDFMLRPWHGAAWLAAAGLGGFNCATAADGASVTMGLQRGVPLLCAGLAATAAASQWRADLVEGRRRLRVFIAATGIAYTLAMLVVRLGSPHGRLSGLWSVVDVAALLAIAVVVAWRALGLVGTDLLPPQPVPAPSPPALPPQVLEPVPPAVAPVAASDPAEDTLAEALQQVMAEERAYRTEDLGIAGLAARLGVPEYRLRRLINQRLGHRNFNAFVNGFRLADARAALADPARRELPVLTIALDAGFQSIGPFNRAFKAATGLTPSEFRRQQLADS